MSIDAQATEMDVENIGRLGVRHLKSLWHRRLEALENRGQRTLHPKEENLDRIVLDGLGLGIVEPDKFLFQTQPSFEKFERWIVDTLGGEIAKETVARVNQAVADCLADQRNDYPLRNTIAEPVLTADDLAFWEENGYVVLRNAIHKEDARAAELAVWAFLGMDPQRPETWYEREHIFWVSFFYHPALARNRQSTRIHKAFAQLWGTENLLMTIDQTSLNRPEQDEACPISGPSKLHWDTSIHQPMPFGVQGILYLNDVAADQGAFQCVPGFHHQIKEWLEGLPPGEDPREAAQVLDATPIAAGAGDLIIWRHDLPHGSSRNLGRYPRVAQYLKMYPPDFPINPVWK